MRVPDTPGWYVEDDVAASVKKARKSDTPISSIIWGLESAFSDDTPKERIKRIVESIPDEDTKTPNADLPLSQPPTTDAQPREQPARIISIQDLSYLSPREAARVIGLTLEQFDGNTVRPPANESTACDLYWRRQKSTVGIRIIPSVGDTVAEDDILPLNEEKTSIDSVQSPSQLAVVTNGKFSDKAKKTADQNNIQRYDGGHVEAWFRRAKIPPGALGAVLEHGENHQGPLDELVDISGIADAISLDPFESSRVIDEADLSTSSDLGSPKQGSSNSGSSSGGTPQQTGGSEQLSQPDSPSTSGETGTLYADPSEDGDYGAFDRFVDGIGSDSSSSVSGQEQNGTPQDSSNQQRKTLGDDSTEDESEYECAICGETYVRYRNYSTHISRCTGSSSKSKTSSKESTARDNKKRSEYECDNCGATYTDHQKYAAHVGGCKGGNPKSKTTATAQDQGNTSASGDDDDSQDKPPYVCPKCGDEYKYERVMEKHQYSCDGTGSPTSGRSANNSASPGESPYICPDCGKEFKYERVMKKHQYSCDGESAAATESETDFEWNNSEDISRKDLLFELVKVKSNAGEPVSRRDLNNYGDYGAPQYEKEFGSVQEALDIANMDFAGDQS